MTGNTRRNPSKGMAIIGWVLMIGFTIAAATMVITWSQSRTKALTEETVQYVEGRMDCQQVRLANVSTTCPNQVGLRNFGTLNIAKVSAQINDETSEVIDLELQAQGPAQTLTTPTDFNKLKIIPILKTGKDLVGCRQKSVTVYCP